MNKPFEQEIVYKLVKTDTENRYSEICYRDKDKPNRYWFKFPENWTTSTVNERIIGFRSLWIPLAQRILTYNLNPFNMSNSPYICIGNLTPKALYLGEYISEYDKLALIEIAKQKGLPVYQMKTKMYKNRCKLIPILIQET